jgi:hypothetical protein
MYRQHVEFTDESFGCHTHSRCNNQRYLVISEVDGSTPAAHSPRLQFNITPPEDDYCRSGSIAQRRKEPTGGQCIIQTEAKLILGGQGPTGAWTEAVTGD